MLATPSNMMKIERMLNDFKELNDKVDKEQSAKIAKLEKKVAVLEKMFEPKPAKSFK